MSNSPVSPAQSGAPISIAASEWNDLMRMRLWFNSQKTGDGGSGFLSGGGHVLGYNDSGSDCPRGGCVRLNGRRTVKGQWVVNFKKPSTSFHRAYGIALEPIKSTKRGLISISNDCDALYNSGTPAFDETYGPTADQWYLTKNQPGFYCHGISDSTKKLIMVTFANMPYQTLLGKNTGAISKGSAGTINIWTKQSGSWTAYSSWSVSAEMLTAAAPSGAKYIGIEHVGGIWVGTPAEC
jgi:hypothetical protein